VEKATDLPAAHGRPVAFSTIQYFLNATKCLENHQ
jgi:hypothetical protein